MKHLRLDPEMTIQLFQQQVEQVLGISVFVYKKWEIAAASDRLSEVGYNNADCQICIDTTLTVRDFETWMADEFHINLELCRDQSRPLTNKCHRLYQIMTVH
jgi:hypothetical protein